MNWILNENSLLINNNHKECNYKIMPNQWLVRPLQSTHHQPTSFTINIPLHCIPLHSTHHHHTSFTINIPLHCIPLHSTHRHPTSFTINIPLHCIPLQLIHHHPTSFTNNVPQHCIPLQSPPYIIYNQHTFTLHTIRINTPPPYIIYKQRTSTLHTITITTLHHLQSTYIYTAYHYN